MNPAAALALVVAALFAVANWVSRAREDRALELVTKPTVMVALIVAAAVLDPAAGEEARRAWFVAALVCSLAGDVFLMLDRFVPGLAAFLVGHLCYLAGFWTDPPSAGALVAAALVAAIPIGLVAVRVARGIRARGEPAVLAPVLGYIVVIGAMVASALACGPPAAAGGAVLFAFSDSVIAWNRFVRPLAWAAVTIMVTYHAGQALLTLSLLA